MFVTTNDRITVAQAAVCLTCTTLGGGLLITPRLISKDVGTPDAWLTVLLGGLFCIISMILMIKLSQKFPNQTIFEYLPQIVGKPIAYLFNLFICIYLLISAAHEIRILAEVLIFYLIEDTPIWAIMLPFMLISYYLLLGGMNTLARLSQLVFPTIILFVVITSALSLSIFDIDNIKPVLGEGFPPVLNGFFHSINCFNGFELVLVYSAFLSPSNKAIRGFSLGLFIVVFIYALTFILLVGCLTLESITLSTWPTIDLMRNFEIKGFFFERIESLCIILWVVQIFTAFSSMYFGASLAASTVFRYKKRPVLLVLLPICYIMAMIPKNINEIDFIGIIISYCCMAVVVATALLYVWVLIRKGDDTCIENVGTP